VPDAGPSWIVITIGAGRPGCKAFLRYVPHFCEATVFKAI
jgi:hypothetical protein